MPGSVAEAQQANNDALATAVVPAPPFKVGTDTVTFTAAVDSAVKTVTHNFGRTPTQVFITPGSPGTGWTSFFVQNFTATTFQVQGHDVDGVARTGSGTFHWMAVG